jgi:hypothetical protein
MGDDLLDMRVKFSRREREVVVHQEKCTFLERINADLQLRLDAFEAEELKRQAGDERQACLVFGCCKAS